MKFKQSVDYIQLEHHKQNDGLKEYTKKYIHDWLNLCDYSKQSSYATDCAAASSLEGYTQAWVLSR